MQLDGGNLSSVADHDTSAPGDLFATREFTIARIRYRHRRRCFLMEQRKRSLLALGAYVRIELGWSRSLPEKERKKIAALAIAMIKRPVGSICEEMIVAHKASQKPFGRIENRLEREMKMLGESLPVWRAFGSGIRGFGATSLGVIVAEAGDLSSYCGRGGHSKLWKRMGLAFMDVDGVRQGGLPKGSSSEAWMAHGYNRRRRSRMWNIGDALIKGNRGGKYRTAYLSRKAYELARDPDMTPMHAHRRAQRYMEKLFLRDVWKEWRRASQTVRESANHSVPAVTLT